MKDYAHFYQKLSSGIRQSTWLLYLVKAINGWVAYLMYVLYPFLLLYLLLTKSAELLFFIGLPALGFLLVSLFRKIYNQPRPYEAWELSPLIEKNTKGSSFPSRHVFSASLIAMCFLRINFWLGTILLVLSAVLAIARVIAGVHYPKDVLAGFVIGIAWGALLFLI